MISPLVKESDRHSKGLMARLLEKPGSSTVSELYSHQRRTLVDCPQQTRLQASLLLPISMDISKTAEDAQRVLQAKKHDGVLEEMPPQTARAFFHLLPTLSLFLLESPRGFSS